jgi:hypothetical protein
MVKAQSNNQSHKDKEHELLENTFNFLDGSRIISEEFSGKEINGKSIESDVISSQFLP